MINLVYINGLSWGYPIEELDDLKLHRLNMKVLRDKEMGMRFIIKQLKHES